MKVTGRRAVHERLAEARPVLLVATDRYICERFDCPRLDTLSLAFPVSASQRSEQYAGRVVREHPGKETAEVHDYRSAAVPMLKAMAPYGVRLEDFPPEGLPDELKEVAAHRRARDAEQAALYADERARHAWGADDGRKVPF